MKKKERSYVLVETVIDIDGIKVKGTFSVGKGQFIEDVRGSIEPYFVDSICKLSKELIEEHFSDTTSGN